MIRFQKHVTWNYACNDKYMDQSDLINKIMPTTEDRIAKCIIVNKIGQLLPFNILVSNVSAARHTHLSIS